jgi:DNA replication factor GINS
MAWKQELESAELRVLPPDFYSNMAEYLRRLKEESRMLDKRTVKANLLKNEARNVKRMLLELIQARCRKLIRMASNGKNVRQGMLTVEEERIYTGILPFAEACTDLLKSLVQGHAPKADAKREHRRVVLRILRETPAIIGTDMKAYGPFKIEDVASLPLENAKIFVKQGLAEKVETD